MSSGANASARTSVSVEPKSGSTTVVAAPVTGSIATTGHGKKKVATESRRPSERRASEFMPVAPDTPIGLAVPVVGSTDHTVVV